MYHSFLSACLCTGCKSTQIRRCHQPVLSPPAQSTGLADTGYTGGLFSGPWHGAVMWHLEGHSTFLLLLPPAAAGLEMIISIISTPAATGNTEEPPADTGISQCANHCVHKFCHKTLLPGEIYALNQRKTGGKRQKCWSGWARAAPHPRLNVLAESNTHSSCAQNSWVAHRGLKHRETHPECPEENPQSTPLVFANNCTLKITGTSIWHKVMPRSTFPCFCFSMDAESCLK